MHSLPSGSTHLGSAQRLPAELMRRAPESSDTLTGGRQDRPSAVQVTDGRPLSLSPLEHELNYARLLVHGKAVPSRGGTAKARISQGAELMIRSGHHVVAGCWHATICRSPGISAATGPAWPMRSGPSSLQGLRLTCMPGVWRQAATGRMPVSMIARPQSQWHMAGMGRVSHSRGNGRIVACGVQAGWGSPFQVEGRTILRAALGHTAGNGAIPAYSLPRALISR